MTGYRLVITVESPNGPPVRGIDNRLARTIGSFDTERDALQEVERLTERCAWDGDPMNVTIRGHHHTEDGQDVTRPEGAAAVRQARARARGEAAASRPGLDG